MTAVTLHADTVDRGPPEPPFLPRPEAVLAHQAGRPAATDQKPGVLQLPASSADCHRCRLTAQRPTGHVPRASCPSPAFLRIHGRLP